jgi:hypothetical protein
VSTDVAYGLPIAMAMAAARNGKGSDTAARNQTNRGRLMFFAPWCEVDVSQSYVNAGKSIIDQSDSTNSTIRRR